jgi:hypothetical protein
MEIKRHEETLGHVPEQTLVGKVSNQVNMSAQSKRELEWFGRSLKV